ncbi:hypothetical protein [Sandarakinorhabdus oryzae]|uniref:hypothetical protein n=1 Tax=Sandarakinorhabdus oryzae TaxID=2675220 RepID=UPI0012E2E1DC|nr:hypothetical protein [Sandarakinorhabdus oryzae]
MSKPVYRKLMASLLDALGLEWHRARADLIYRTDKKYLMQCITCQSSNFSSDYVPATFVHILPKGGDFLRSDIGDRIKTPRSGFLGLKPPRDLWLDGSSDPPLADVLRLATAKAIIPFDSPLTVEALAAQIDRSSKSSFEYAQWWSAGIVYGLCGRPDQARTCLDRARKQLERLQSRLDKDGIARWDWVGEALAAIAQARLLLEHQRQFSTWCRSIAATSAAALGLTAYV